VAVSSRPKNNLLQRKGFSQGFQPILCPPYPNSNVPKTGRRRFIGARLPVSGRTLPQTLLVAIGLQPLAAFVLRHLETALLLKISHGVGGLVVKEGLFC
jgi:hypothetical protein